MINQNLFDQIRKLPMADQNVIKRLEDLEPDNMEMFEPNRLIVDYFWHFPDGRVRSQITIDWHSEKPLIYINAVSNNSPRFQADFTFLYGTCRCHYLEEGRGRYMEPEEFWDYLASILDAEEDPTSQKTGF